jgi:TonB family protein
MRGGKSGVAKVIFLTFIRINPTIMRKPLPILLLLFILPHANLSAQEREQITHTSGPKNAKTGEVYDVLKEDTTIKDGQYQLLRGGKIILTGHYDHGQKDSVWESYGAWHKLISRRWYAKGQRNGQWEFFGYQGEPEWSYDFTTNKATVQRLVQPFSDPSACYYPSDSGAWVNTQPDKPLIVLSGSGEWLIFLNRTLRYPDEAVNKNLMGDVLISVNVDETGAITDFGIAKSAAPSLDAEALRIVKLYPFEFIPAEKVGKKIKAQLRVPVRFKLENGN